jgi:hypothetical protein
MASCRHTKTDVKLLETQSLQPEYNQLISDSLIYDFMTYKIALIKEEDTNNIILINYTDYFFWSKNDSMSILKLDSLSNQKIFDPSDLPFIFDQIKLSKTFLFKQKFLSKTTLIPYDTIRKLLENDSFWPDFRLKYKGRRGFWILSVPVFSIDKQTVIQDERFVCGGFCGSGMTNIYRKIKTSWKLIFSYNFMIS